MRNTSTYTHEKNESTGSAHTPAEPQGWLSFDRYVDGLWFLEYSANNIDSKDPLGDGSNRIVRAQPFGEKIRVSMLVVLERNDAPEATYAWHAQMMWRYWGSSDPLGRDDHKSLHVFGGSDVHKMRSTIGSGLSRLQRDLPTSGESIVTPLRYVAVGGSSDKFAHALQSVGLAMTVHGTGRTLTADDIRRLKTSTRLH